jgi:glutaconyl-CoA/methylmalonyl-CoA decarboxylase subunit gamma
MIKKFKVKVSNKEYEVEVEEMKKTPGEKKIEVILPEIKKEKESETKKEVKVGKKPGIKTEPVKSSAAKVTKPEQKEDETIGKMDVIAPLPGIIVDILVKRGEKIKENEAVIILEAMKMENALLSPIYGIVEQIHVKKGQTVNGDYPLITIVG